MTEGQTMADAQIDFGELLADPMATIAKAQQQSWIADGGLAPIVLRYDEVRQVLTEPSFHASFDSFVEAAGVTDGPFREWMRLSPLNHDGPEHKQWRSLLTRTFTPKSVEQLRPKLADAAHGLIDGFADRGECELVAEFADVYPSIGLCELIGVPVEDRDRFRGWADAVGMGFNLPELVAHQREVDDATVQLNAYATELVAKRRAEPRDDLVSRIATAAVEEGGIWDDAQVAGTIAGLVFAGHETTKNQLGMMVNALAERPDLWDGVSSGAVEVGPLVDEVLRYHSAVTSIGRKATATFEHDGTTIQPGDTILTSLWAANHDPRAFPDHADLDVEANNVAPHAAFGHGAHHCIGANLARAELQEALRALSARLTCPVVGADATWRLPLGITGPVTLPITFSRR